MGEIRESGTLDFGGIRPRIVEGPLMPPGWFALIDSKGKMVCANFFTGTVIEIPPMPVKFNWIPEVKDEPDRTRAIRQSYR